MSALLDAADIDSLARTGQRFAQDRVRPACERHDQPLTSDTLVALRAEAVQLGLLEEGPEAGFGLWTSPEDPGSRALSVRVLRELARVNAGVAFHLHTTALARCTAQAFALPCEGAMALGLHGAWGFGRGALPRWLRGHALTDEEAVLLADTFANDEPRDLAVHAERDWLLALLPSFDPATGTLGLRAVAREHLSAVELPRAHGLDELPLWRLRCGRVTPTVATATPAPDQARTRFASAWCLHALGTLAIGEGALAHAYAEARSYAGMRKQGGEFIDRYPAVQALLGNAHAAVQAAHHALEGLVALAPGCQTLPSFLGLRAQLHPQLCAGANDALQVFGGLGYMRDVGMEKIVRDLNCLRVLGGSPGTLHRFVAEWERT